MFPKSSVKMIDGSEKRNRQLAFELQNSHVCEKRSNMSHQKRVRTLESFFARNQSQSESEKNDTEEEQCIDQEKTDEDRRKPKKSPTFLKTWLRDHTWLRYEKEAMFCYFCRKSKTNPFAMAEGCINFRTSTLQELFSTALDVWARTNRRISTCTSISN